MTNTFVTAVRHTLIRKDKRKSLHAAINTEAGWKTACGETFPVAEVQPFTGSEAAAEIEARLDDICRRCERVGATLL